MCVSAKLRILSSDMLAQRCPCKLTKEELSHEIARALLKRRIMTYLVGKFRGTDEETVDYTPGREPSKVLQIFSTLEAFRSSDLSSDSTASLPWLAKLPSWQLDVLTFLTKMLRPNPSIEEALDVVMQKDLQISPEVALQSDAFTKTKALDLEAVLATKAEAEMPKAPEPVPAEEPAEPPPAVQDGEKEDESQLVIPRPSKVNQTCHQHLWPLAGSGTSASWRSPKSSEMSCTSTRWSTMRRQWSGRR